uniref:Uncharacterized protein n=1 Tax=Hyaloperonospora arabidopsidis (strain Emoy2) TaxID=559515 RepID=M4BC91_HYAAE
MNAEGTRAASSTWKEGRTRYRRGKSGTPASSRFGSSLDVHFDGSGFGKAAAVAGSSYNGKRWQRRASTALEMEKSTTFSSGWSTSLDGGEGSCFSKLFPVPASPRMFRAGAMPVKNKTSSSLSSAMTAAEFVFPTREDNHAVLSDIRWSVGGTNKRGTVRKDRRNGKSSMCVSSIGRSRTRVATTRSTPILCDVNDDNEGRVSDGGANPFAFGMQQTTSSRGSGRVCAGLTLSRNERVDKCAAADSCRFDVDEKLLRVRPTASPSILPSVASVGSTTLSCDLQSFSTVDPLVVRARAVLQDCIRTRKMEQNNTRKRSIEGCFGGSQLESKWYGWHDDSLLKPVECGVASPRSR